MSLTVKDLIEKLKEHNQDLEVVFGNDEWVEISSVKADDNEGIQNPVVVLD